MSDYPNNTTRGDLAYVSSQSFEAGEMTLVAGLAGASTVFPAANLIIYVPFFVTNDLTVYQMDTFNGTVVGGNTDIGIYDIAGNRLVSSGATLMAGTSTPQVFNTTDTLLKGGKWYYMAMTNTTTTATFFRTALSAPHLQAAGVKQQAGAGTLPSTATFAIPTNAYLPLFGLYYTSLAI